MLCDRLSLKKIQLKSEHPTSASITSIKEKVLNLNDQTAFPAFGKSGGGEKSAGAAFRAKGEESV